MPRPPTTITIVPSRLSPLAQGLVALGVLGWLGLHAPGWATLSATLVLTGVLWATLRRRSAGQLRCVTADGAAPRWDWREEVGRDWRETVLRCDYLGPWLIGLRLDGRRLWLWPDSSDAESLRCLRRVLVSLP